MNKRYFKHITLFLAMFVIASFVALGEEHKHDGHDAHADNAHAKEFNAGEMIVDHIKDSYEWHILTWGKTHVSIPLPIILYDTEESKLVTFLSSKFHHGHDAYKGYMIAHEGDNKGSIVKVDSHGHEIKGAALPLDFSITKNVFAIFVSALLLIWIFTSIARRYTKRGLQAPKGLQSILEPLILFIRDDIARPSIGEKKYQRYMPFLLTVFFFIFLNNLLGLVPIFPGGANVTGNITVTMVLALFTFIITTAVGNRNYWQHIFNAPGVPWWLKIPIPLMPIVELLGVFTKPIVLMIRLFANILAGHIIILGFMSLIFIFGAMNVYFGYGASVISLAFGLFMSLLELLVAFIQAFVFTMLSALYFGMAVEEHH